MTTPTSDRNSNSNSEKPAQASSKARGAKLRISSGSAAVYQIRRGAEDQRECEDRLIADALALLDSRLQRGEAFTSPEQAMQFCKLRLQRLQREIFLVLFLDCRHRLIAAEEMFHGTIDGCEIHPREVAKRALELNAAACIFSHPHPSGVAEPSMADRSITARLRDALALLEIRVLDHIIIGDGAPVSMAQRGLL